MLKKRIIPCLDCHQGRVVKGTQFKAIRDVGDPVGLAQYYADSGADELVFYDISASTEGRKTHAELAAQVARVIQIPFTIGGGIQSLEDFYTVLGAGADKVSVNTAAFLKPALVTEAAKRFGSQCVVVSMDLLCTKGGRAEVYLYGGRQATGKDAIAYAQEVEALGAGELVINAIHADGVKGGYDIALLSKIAAAVRIPIIASGGAGQVEDFALALTEGRADGALAASVFHSGQLRIQDLKEALSLKQIPMRMAY